MRKLLLKAALLALVLGLFPSFLPAEAQAGTVVDQVLVKYKDSYLRSFANEGGNRQIVPLSVPEGITAEEFLTQIKTDPAVELAEPNYIRWALENTSRPQSITDAVYHIPNDPKYEQQWGLPYIYTQYAWPLLEKPLGNVTIAVIDSGVDLDHPDLLDNIVEGYDFVDDDPIADDEYGHGTHVAGVAAALRDNNEGIAGIAGGVKIMPVRVLDNMGHGSVFPLANGIYWAVDHGADIINLSLGGTDPSDIEKEAIDYALNNGVLVVAAAGNDGIRLLSYPAAYPGVMAVTGAADSGGIPVLTGFSNWGPEAEISAPALDIFSTYPLALDTHDGTVDGYTYMSGTSQATPVIAGVLALIKSQNLSLDSQEIKNILFLAADDEGDAGWDEQFGHGLVNPYSTLSKARLLLEVQPAIITGEGEALVSVTSFDAYGNVSGTVYGGAADVNVSSSVYESVYIETLDYNTGMLLNSGAVSELVYGQAKLSILLEEPGVYYFRGYGSGMLDDVSQTVTVKPYQPVSNIDSGTYTVARTVYLSTATGGADIYYTTDGSQPTPGSQLYSQGLFIESTCVVKAAAYKNGILSDTAVFEYTIEENNEIDAPADNNEINENEINQPADNNTGNEDSNTGAPGGGGGGGGGIPLTPAAPEFTESEENLIEQLEDENLEEVEVALIAKEGEKALDFKADLLKQVFAKGKSMSLKSEGVKISLVPGSLTIDDAAGKENRVHISVANTEMPEQELNGLKLRGSINDITIKMVTEDGTTRNLTAFNTPLEISFAYDTNADEEKLGIYYYNEEQRQWEFIGGNINREDNYIYAEVNHLSKYAVMEFEKTFADITQHWARRSIEVMAAKHITRGLTETQFGPGKMVTRAEFATLLVKTLGLKPRGVDVFKDVPADAWYNGGVRAAYHAGLVEGRGEGRFDPSAPITRQEMASLIIKAYMNKTGENLNEHRTSQEIRFTDEQHVASWAHWSVILANALGLMQGFGDESFRPEETSTRAQAIVVLKKLYDIEK